MRNNIDEIIHLLTTTYSCDGFEQIDAERIGRRKWLLKFYTWGGYVIEIITKDIKMRKAQCEELVL